MKKHKRIRKTAKRLYLAFITLTLAGLLSIAQNLQAQTASTPATDLKTLHFILVAIASILLLAALLTTVVILVALDKFLYPEGEKSIFPKISFTRLWQKFVGINATGSAGGATEVSLLMPDHEYDQIRELDNPPPPLFNYVFYGTIAFSLIYLVYFHLLDGPLMKEEYENEVRLAALQRKQMQNLVDENTVGQLTESSELAAGKDIYLQNCTSCHGQVGEGLVGPNLTDAYWLHGGSIKDVFKTIKYGVPEKGMIPWQSQLSPSQMAQVASYILSLQGSNPPNAKQPEGELFQAVENNASNATPKKDAQL
jgi:cytochrome c oxidase cbb3-type subunit 3